MPFLPVVTLSAVPRDNSSYTLTDATPTGGSNGYGASNAPANQAAITSLFGMVQPYGELPINAVGFTGTLATTLTFQMAVQDGVNTFMALYGLAKTFTDWHTSIDGTQIITNDPNIVNLLDSVGYISTDGISFPVAIISIIGNTINLAGTVPPNLSGTQLYVYYSAAVQALTINNGESLCVNGISLMPIEADSCDNANAIIHNILLKLAAEIAFNCGNISKAHEAARLLGGGTASIVNLCPTCK